MITGKKYTYIFHLVLLILAGISETFAAEIVIQGNAPSYAGEKLTFYTYSNMISFRETVVASCMVNDSGNFECRADIEEIRLIFTSLGIYKCLFYAEPGFIYQIRLPSKIEKTVAEAANPYFEEVTIHLVVKPTGSTNGDKIPPLTQELNFLIRTFNDSFHPFYYKYVINAYLNAVDRQEIDRAIADIKAPFEGINNNYFLTYLEYRIGLLVHFGAQQSSQKIINDYFKNHHIFHYNPAYMELFNEVFAGYFDLYISENPKSGLASRINREANLEKVLELFRKDKNLENDTLIELMVIKNLYDGYFNQNYSKPSIIILLDSLKSMSKIAYHKLIIDEIKAEITKLMVGTPAPSFELYDRDSNLISLDNFSGQYVYLSFCNSFSYYCIMEFELLNDLISRHQNHLAIITILVDDSFRAMRDLLRANKYNWTFVHYSNQPDVIDNYDIQAYPAYYLIGPDGKLIASPAPSPSEGFESYLIKVLRARGEI
ncbi:MAG: hypothetical protein AMS27_15140 [Bacteroides sp. SM23_62_1]|nr:MAG: hypothetical protein AMS27_15140 [Bacteroides sp. SM23_62_1]